MPTSLPTGECMNADVATSAFAVEHKIPYDTPKQHAEFLHGKALSGRYVDRELKSNLLKIYDLDRIMSGPHGEERQRFFTPTVERLHEQWLDKHTVDLTRIHPKRLLANSDDDSSLSSIGSSIVSSGSDYTLDDSMPFGNGSIRPKLRKWIRLGLAEDPDE